VEPVPEFYGRLAKLVEDTREALKQGSALTPTRGKEIFGEHFANQWTRLARICTRLTILAHKKLRQVRFNKEDNKYLTEYGEQLAGVMLYGGNSYSKPRDDAPRIADVFTNPTAGEHLLVGIARPRALWVLYPVRGVDVLCRGAVLPYYEFTHPRRLTGATWKSLLDSPKRPKSPDWIRPIMTAEGTGK
jgi:hypothetical protein